MTVVDQWTGHHARALQSAMRLTNEAFAEHLGVSARTVAKWRERPAMVPSPQLQEALDTSLSRATADIQARFAAKLADAAGAAGAAGRGQDQVGVHLDDSVMQQLHAAVGDLARVLARITDPRITKPRSTDPSCTEPGITDLGTPPDPVVGAAVDMSSRTER